MKRCAVAGATAEVGPGELARTQRPSEDFMPICAFDGTSLVSYIRCRPTCNPSPAALAEPDALVQPAVPADQGLILQSLQAGEWKPGEPIPSEIELAARFRVSQGTVRKAIDELAAENLVVRRQGKGTFVATHAEQHVQYRFLRLVPDSGDADSEGPPSARSSTASACAPAPTSRALLGAAHRRCGAAGPARAVVPRRADHSRRPLAAGRALQGPDGRAAAPPARARCTRCSKPNSACAWCAPRKRSAPCCRMQRRPRCLPCPPRTPLLSVERVAYTYDDTPMELRRGLYRTDTHHYRNELG